MIRYEKYKDVSWYEYVKEIPENWEVLPNVAIFNERRTKNNKDEENLSVSKYRGIIKSSEHETMKDRVSENTSEYLLVKEDDIAYNTMLMWSGAVGRSTYRGIVSPSYTVLQPKEKINSGYFHYLFRTSFYCDYSRRFSYGINDARLRLYYTYFKRMYSIVPPMDEQNIIVDYLDKKQKQSDEFILKQNKIVELLKEQKKAIINKAVTKGINPNVKMKDSGVEWLGEIPEHWEVSKLKHLLQTRLKYGANESAELDDKNLPRYIRITDFGDNGELKVDTFKSLPLEKAKEYYLREGDILFARSGATVGKTFQFKNYKGKACFAGYLIKASVNEKKILSDYLYLFTKSYSYDEWKNSIFNKATIENIGADKYSVLDIPIPLLEEQKMIVKYIEEKISKIDIAISKAEQEVKLAKEYMESLIFNVVTGQIKVE